MKIAADPAPVARFADRRGLMGLLLKNMTLNIVTLGFYRFWARARLRRHVWRRIEIAGDPLEYTGTGGELFKGFLIALVVLLPLFTVYGIVEAVLPVDETMLIVRNLVFYAVLGLLYLVAVFRARRYRLSRTAWRGIRFGQDGSLRRYVLGSIGWAALMPFTLSLAWPWWSMWERRFLMNATLFGDRRFACDARGGPMFKYWLGVILTAGLGFVWYRVREARHVAAHTTLGDVAFASGARSRVIYGRALLYALVLALTGGVGYVVFDLLFTQIAMGLGEVSVSSRIGLAAAGAGFVTAVIFLVLQPLLAWPMVYVPVLRHAFATLAIENVGALDLIAQSSLAVSSSGEGLADAFDVDFG